ncbi:MAG TPA: HAMP domain-containing sensor histidine kinase [Candidatus Krumholzibacteria bacterium]|nr:HAMP domain-containing sensor histidine kinase [Candidatus Krumholzibacteria bacterium]
MDIRTAEDRTATLESLLNDARIEANDLRARVERYRRIIASTRLVMGHELKKPATAISGYLELAGEDVAQAGLAEAMRLIEKARAECELLGELNAFYLELLRVDSGTGTPHVERVNVEELVLEVMEQAEPGLDAPGRVRMTIVDSLPRVSMNRNALKLIVLNLIENALKYSPSASPVRFEVEVSRNLRGSADGELLKLRVSDEGGGISEDDLKRVFRPFVRLDDNVEGSGLGLTLVRSLVDMCDGEVSVRSEPGHGTTVFVTLPLLPGENPGVVLP